MAISINPFPRYSLATALKRAVAEAYPGLPIPESLQVGRSQHADYQTDLPLLLARTIQISPRDVAARLAERLVPDELIERAAVSGPGFINFTVQSEYLGSCLSQMNGDDRLGTPPARPPEKVIVDYSAPNVAKEMHVGHLRPTIIGDALARILEFLGHDVIRQNHIGDWGTPFGMLIEYLDREGDGFLRTGSSLSDLYRAARAQFDSDGDFATRSRARVVALQSGDGPTLAVWQKLVDVSLAHFSELYKRLNVTLRPEDVAGESRYNSLLRSVVEDLVASGLAVQSDGAWCVFPPGYVGRDGRPAPLIVQKSDGGFGYATTDLAALRFRTSELGARLLLYVVGSPQQQHFEMVFATARLAGWVDPSVRLEHVAFGSILGPDRRMFKTRSGEVISLASLLDEAVNRAMTIVRKKYVDAPDEEQVKIAEAIGIGAIKYADLCNDRIKDYVFDWDRMLAFEGNTAPYLIYAHARIRSILRKAEWPTPSLGGRIDVTESSERALGLELLEYPSTLQRVAETFEPHRLCSYLHSVAAAFTRFYEDCPVLRAETSTQRASRLGLCALVARVLSQGLECLGIVALERM